MGRTTIRCCTTATTTNMKSIVMILCLGLASANPQGFGGLGISGQGSAQGFGLGQNFNFQQSFAIQEGFCGEIGVGGMQGQGCRANQQTQGCPAPNINKWATVCPGNLKRFCFGQGLENPCAVYVFPQSVQCMARAAQRASTGGDSFRVRVDYDGTAYITDTFGTALEDVEIVETGFGLQAQQAAATKQFKYESLLKHTETWCGGNRR